MGKRVFWASRMHYHVGSGMKAGVKDTPLAATTLVSATACQPAQAKMITTTRSDASNKKRTTHIVAVWAGI